MTGIVGQSVASITSAVRAVFTAEQISDKNGFLQKCDPRIVVASIGLFALSVMITRDIAIVALLGCACIGLAMISSVPIDRLLRRSSVVPLFSGVVVLPQLVLLDGPTVWSVLGVSITMTGIEYVVFFILRVGVGVGFLSLLVLTTSFSEIISAMRALYIPTPLVWVITITYRYLFLFFDELQRLVIARNSRTTGRSDLRGGWEDARRLIGTFLLRTLDRGERVGRGMRARGGASSPTPYTKQQQLTASDYVLLIASMITVCSVGVIQWGIL